MNDRHLDSGDAVEEQNPAYGPFDHTSRAQARDVRLLASTSHGALRFMGRGAALALPKAQQRA